MFVYEVSGCGFESRCSHLNFRFYAHFNQGVPWHSGNYRGWIHSKTRTWHDKKIQSNAPYRKYSQHSSTFDFSGPNLSQNEFWGWNFKTVSLDLEFAPRRYHVCQVSAKTDSFEFFRLNLRKLYNYVQYLVLITLRVLQRDRWRLKWAGWRWMELGGDRWRWMEVGGDGSTV